MWRVLLYCWVDSPAYPQEMFLHSWYNLILCTGCICSTSKLNVNQTFENLGERSTLKQLWPSLHSKRARNRVLEAAKRGFLLSSSNLGHSCVYLNAFDLQPAAFLQGNRHMLSFFKTLLQRSQLSSAPCILAKAPGADQVAYRYISELELKAGWMGKRVSSWRSGWGERDMDF